MKRMMIAAAAALFALPAFADERANVLKHFAQALAVAKLCDKVEVADGQAAVIAVAYGIDLNEHRSELLAEAQRQMAPWSGKGADAACVAGMLLYGPDGENVPGLLRWK